MSCPEFLSIVQKGVREFPCEKAVRELREAHQLNTVCGGDHYLSVAPGENLAKALALANTLHPDCRLRFFRELNDDLRRARHPELTPRVFEKWLELAEGLGDEEARAADLWLISLGLRESWRSLKDGGLVFWTRLFAAAQKIGDETLRLQTLSDLAANFSRVGFVDPALGIFGELLDAAEKRANEKNRILSVNILSSALSVAEAGERSRPLFLRILNWVEHLSNASDREIQLGALHRDLGRAGLKDLRVRVERELGWK